MIFVTVGTQLAFPRLIAAMNDYAATSGEEVIAQVGADEGDWPNLSVVQSLPPTEFEATFLRARVVVAHAGVGTILSARQHHRPLIVVPRRLVLGEHRNDHQLDMARSLKEVAGVHVAWQVEDLPALLARQDLMAAPRVRGAQLDTLITGIVDFIGAPGRVPDLRLIEGGEDAEEEVWPLAEVLTGARKNSAESPDRMSFRSRRPGSRSD